MRHWRAITALLLGLVLVGWMAARIPFDLLLARASDLPGWAWAGAMAGLATTYVLRAGRLHAEWASRHSPSLRECLQVTLVHNAAINLLPMRAGEASYPWLLHKRWGVTVAEATVSLLWLRVQDALVLALGGIVLLPWAAWPQRLGVATVIVLCGVLAAPRLIRGLRFDLMHLADSIAAGRWARWSARLRRVANALSAGRGGAAAWAFCVANWTLKLIVIGGLLTQLADLSLWSGVAGALAGELAAVLPVQAPAGIGTYEAGVLLGARSYTALPAGEVLGAALVVHALMLVLSWLCALALPLLRTPVGAVEETPS